MQVIRKKQIIEKMGCSEMTLDRYVRDPAYAHFNFPKPRYIGRHPIWDEAEVNEWFESLPRESA